MLKPVFGIFAVLGWLILMGLHQCWRHTFGWLFRTLADFLDVDIGLPHLPSIHPFRSVANWLRSLDRNVDAQLVNGANALERVPVWLFSRVGHFFDWIGSRIAALALAVEHAIRKLIRVTIPHLIRRALRLVWRELRSVSRYARKLIPQLRRALFGLARFAKRRIVQLLKQAATLFRLVHQHWRLLWRSLSGAWKLLRALNRKLVSAGFYKLVGGALKRLGLGALFSSNFGQLVKWIATHPIDAVIEWVRDELAPLVPGDICEVGELTYDAAVFVFEPIFRELIGLENKICPSSRGHLPSAVTYPADYALAWTPSGTPSLAGAPERLAPDSPLPVGVRA